ncbi:MAG: hypothetical protein HN348_11745 [Proteobacteria bacterium]|jgi:hypothetical protein|nr:hypothetical protein [Pseudomonadota bacterium]
MTTANLAEQALANLVNQFARPMDFLRELVQNSIDATSPRIEVWLEWQPEESQRGVLAIHVDDFGMGMDEQIIDGQLTRLFSSTKEDDLTKIGKFGIGFTSIFAINPQAVLLQTGRHGESWELVFHGDRSFTRRRKEQIIEGTKITLFKRMRRDEVEPFVREAQWILTYWCEHSNTPITFHDRTVDEESQDFTGDDPFADFADPSSIMGATPINRPLELEADLVQLLVKDDIEVLVGLSRTPRFSYYNAGLTLLNTTNEDVLGSQFLPRLRHLSFKVKSNALEHTLTRDNVLQDNHWFKAMNVVVEAAGSLREKLLDRVELAISNGEDPAPWHEYLTRECQSQGTANSQEAPFYRDWVSRVLFADHRGNGHTLRAIERQERRMGCVLIDPGPGALRQTLEEEGLIMLPDSKPTRRFLDACVAHPLFSQAIPREHRRADDIFVLPEIVEESHWTIQERTLLNKTTELLMAAVGSSLVARALGPPLSVRLGNFGGQEAATHDVLAIDGPKDGGAFQRPRPRWLRPPAFLHWRCLLVNRHHPFFKAQLLSSVDNPLVSSFSLAQALLSVEGIEGDATFHALLNSTADMLEKIHEPT